MYGCVNKMAENHNTKVSCVRCFFRLKGIMLYQDSHCESARATATTSRDAYHPPSFPPLRRVARPVPRRWQKRHSRRWFLAWLQRHVHQTLAELEVASPAVSASGTVIVIVIVRVDEIGPAKARWYLGTYYSVSVPAQLRCAITFLEVRCEMVAKVMGTVSMVGGWKG